MVPSNLKSIVDNGGTVISAKYMTDDSLIALVDYMHNHKSSNVTELYFTESQITKTGIEKLVTYTKLRSLDLSDNALTDDDIQPLQMASGLRNICLDGNFLSPQAVESLNQKIKPVFLSYDRNTFIEYDKSEIKSNVKNEPLFFNKTFDSQRKDFNTISSSSSDDKQIVGKKRTAIMAALDEYIKIASPEDIEQVFNELDEKRMTLKTDTNKAVKTS